MSKDNELKDKEDKPVSKTEAVRQLWEIPNLDYKLKGKQKAVKTTLIKDESDVSVILCSRRFGKCIAGSSYIQTTKGIKQIKDITTDDYVYGCDKNGEVSPTKVKQVHKTGKKLVYDLVNNGKVIETSTLDHRWLTIDPRSKKETVRKTKDLRFTDKIVRKFIKSPCGEVNEPHAYAIGALLGDGCSKQGVNNIYISSENKIIPTKCSKILKCELYKNKGTNYTWCLSTSPIYQKSEVLQCNNYDEWCKDRYAHEKYIDIDVIKTWNRDSCLAFLAGLIDTDGSVGVYKNMLQIQFCSQSKYLVDTFRYLFLQLFQYDTNIIVDNRDKYKNGTCFQLCIRNNLFTKIAVKELDKYILTPRKKWKEEYEILLENNTNKNYIGVRLKNPREEETYDIGIDNDTHLYATAKGLITHNSFVLCCWAIEVCLSAKRNIVKYACPEKLMVATIINPAMELIIEDCPPHLKPEWKESKKEWLFPNGSKIQIAGTDKGHVEKLRGGYAQLCICDEAGFMTDLDYVVNSVLAPTTDTTEGRVILASTPNYKEPLHEFHTNFIYPLEAAGTLVKYTVYDSPMVDDKKIKKIIARYPGGVTNSKFRCEYLCEISADKNTMVIPEMTQKLEKSIVKESTKPPFYDVYTSGDPAFRDLTGILFAYYDFKKGALIIEDELVMNGAEMTTESLATNIKEKEKKHFRMPVTNEAKEPFLRIMDNNNLILINDLYMLHELSFIATKKDNKEVQINMVRLMLSKKEIVINPRCKNLLYHIKNAKWDKNRKSFLRMPDSPDRTLRGGHADLLDALIYLVRNLVKGHNPYPENYNELSGEDVFRTEPLNNKKNDKLMKKLYNNSN